MRLRLAGPVLWYQCRGLVEAFAEEPHVAKRHDQPQARGRVVLAEAPGQSRLKVIEMGNKLVDPLAAGNGVMLWSGLGQPQVVVPVPTMRRGRFAALVQLLQGVAAQGLQQTQPGSLGGDLARHKGLVHQGPKQRQHLMLGYAVSGGDRLSGRRRSGRSEHRQAPEQRAFPRVQQVIAPVEECAQCALAHRHVRSRAVSSEKQSSRRAAICSTGSTVTHAAAISIASGSPVQAPADVGDGTHVPGVHGELGCRRGGAVHEQPDVGVRPHSGGEPRHVVGGRVDGAGAHAVGAVGEGAHVLEQLVSGLDGHRFGDPLSGAVDPQGRGAQVGQVLAGFDVCGHVPHPQQLGGVLEAGEPGGGAVVAAAFGSQLDLGDGLPKGRGPRVEVGDAGRGEQVGA